MQRKHEENSIRERLEKIVRPNEIWNCGIPTNYSITYADRLFCSLKFNTKDELIDHIILEHKFKNILDYVK